MVKGKWNRVALTHVEFRRALIPDELRSLVIFDHKAFHAYPGDWFDRDTWRCCEAWWMIVGGKKAGCCAFLPNVDFQEDIRQDYFNPAVAGTLYLVSTGILPVFQGSGLGTLLKAWQISYAKRNGFKRIVTNTRKSNKRMIALNRKFDFRTIRTTPRYYSNPTEATVVMELTIP
jgi:ribosomal protein S18 acetylase RimI-like enzyme